MTLTTHDLPSSRPATHYLGDGTTTRFSFSFALAEASDLEIYLDNAPLTHGFSVQGAGAGLTGGAVTFQTPPAVGARITLRRQLTLQRRGTFLESGPLSARALNDQFDRLTAMVQQVAGDQERMLRLSATDPADGLILPDRKQRAGRLLGFDEQGRPMALPLSATSDALYVAARGAGAVPRLVDEKVRDQASVKDFGAIGDGIADDTGAILAALAAHRSVFLPAGTYRTTATIVLGYGQTLYGEGEGSIIQARQARFDDNALPAYQGDFNAVEMTSSYAALRNLRIVGGASGLKIYGRDGPAVKNVAENLSIWDCLIGIVLDGYHEPDRPCYWNHMARILVARPSIHGVLLTTEGAGDTPNANKFNDVRVYSLSAPLSGCGFFVSAGRFNNSFTDCEANLHPSGQACMRLGAAADQTLITNFYAESLGGLPGVRLDRGSKNASIANLFSVTGGRPIDDSTNERSYVAMNAGFPVRNLMKETHITDLRAEGFSLETRYVEPPAGGAVDADLRSAVHFVSSFGGAVDFRLPAASQANGRMLTIKKTDASDHPVRVVEQGGPGPDGRPFLLFSRHDSVHVASNGAQWWIVHAMRPAGNAQFYDGGGLFRPDMGKDLYLIATGAGTTECRLPPPSDPLAMGRLIVIKKSDPGEGAVLVTAEGASGPDGRTWRLGKPYEAVSVFSNGAGWWVMQSSRPPQPTHFHEAAGLLRIDLGAAHYFISSFAGPVEARLPAPDAGHSGVHLTIKKTDPSPHPVKISSGDGQTGPDGGVQTLAAMHAGLAVVCNGAAWHIVGRF
jgi:Pectate lyase superfamily protein